MDSVGEGEGGEIWENSIETCIISCMKRKKKNNKESQITQVKEFRAFLYMGRCKILGPLK